MGIYTDEKLVIEAYDKLINEDGRCTALEYPGKNLKYIKFH